MQFSAVALLAVAAGVQAASNVTYTTEVVTAYTTFCPSPTEITHGASTYTVTTPTTLTITNCPCTVTKPVTTISSVVCNSCYTNSTTTSSVLRTTGTPVPTTTRATVPTAAATKVVALSGGALAGFLGLAVFAL